MASLARETATFNEHLSALLEKEGKFAAVFEDRVIGTFDTYGDALQAGYAVAGVKPFLVKQISKEARVVFFSRDLCPA